jgi:hypothetical protein
MATIVTRAGKGSPLTNNELDDNFINLNNQANTNTTNIAANTASIANKITQGASGIDNTGPLYYNERTINQNITIAGTDNVLSAGPIIIGDGYTVTVQDGGAWAIV